MAKFQVTLEDGSKYLITTEDQQKNTPFLPQEQEVKRLSETRKDSVATLEKEVRTPYDFKNKPVASLLKPAVTGMKVAAVPFQRGESAVAGLGLGLQKGKPLEGISQFKEGLLGRKQYELGDIVRTTGFGGKANEPLAAATGFTAALVAPIKMMKDGLKSLNAIQKVSDKGLMKASRQLIKGSDDAVRVVGGKLDEAYLKVNSVKVSSNQVLDDVANLPDTVVKYMEKEIGSNLEEFLTDFDISKARKLKKVLGEIKPSAFGKAEKGAVDLIQDKQINKAYGSIKSSMQEALNSSGLKKEANALLRADETFTDTLRASRFIKKTIMDPTLGKPTKTGSMALRMAKEGDLSGRTALNTLKSASYEANRSIMEAVSALDKYNALQSFGKISRRVGVGLLAGGAAGLLGGKISGNMQR